MATTITVPDKKEGMTPQEDAAYHYYMAMQHITHAQIALSQLDPTVDLKIAVNTSCLDNAFFVRMGEMVHAYMKAN